MAPDQPASKLRAIRAPASAISSQHDADLLRRAGVPLTARAAIRGGTTISRSVRIVDSGRLWWTLRRRLLASHALAIVFAAGAWWGARTLHAFPEWGGALLALGIACVGWFIPSWWVERSITLPLVRLRDGVRRIGEGDLTPSVPLRSPDVIGELVEAMTSTGQRLGELHYGLWQANRELEQRVDERTRELIERNRMLESLVNTISHDLRATAVSMHALAGALLEEQESLQTAESTRMLQRLLTLTEHQELLLRDLLTLVRIGKERPEPREVDLNQLLREVLEECRADAAPVAVNLTLPNSHPVAWADPSRLREVLRHLIQNAIKFRESSRELAIEISVEERVGWIQCAVRDNGIGIDPAYHGKIFDLFQRLQEIDAEGTGAGLTIVKQIIEQSGGRIWIESTKGQGTTVVFTMPRPVALTEHHYLEAGR